MNDDPRLGFRLWVDAHLVDETWVNTRDPARLQAVEQLWARQQEIIGKAESDGKRWAIEIYDPAKPADQALRFGTDERAIPHPSRDLSELSELLRRHMTNDED